MNCCIDWELQTKIINGFIGFVSLRGGTDAFRNQGGKQFVFCPWCGTNRAEFERDMKMKVSEIESKKLGQPVDTQRG